MTADARFEAFVEEYQDMVFATAVRLLGRESDAEDVAQTVFMRAFERFDDIGGNPAAPGWLKTVTTNLCLNHLSRYRARWRLFSEIERTDSGPSLETRIARIVEWLAAIGGWTVVRKRRTGQRSGETLCRTGDDRRGFQLFRFQRQHGKGQRCGHGTRTRR